jgi:nitrate reductase gamma subunit
VLAYGPETQKEFLSLLGMENPDWRKMTMWLVLTLTVVSSLIATLLLLQRRHTDPVVRSYQRFCDKLARVGLERQAHEGPLNFCRRAQAQLPQQRAAIQHITDLYIALRYQDTPHHSAIFHSQVRQFRPEKALSQYRS